MGGWEGGKEGWQWGKQYERGDDEGEGVENFHFGPCAVLAYNWIDTWDSMWHLTCQINTVNDVK